jgi:hypothetical protein
MITVVPLAGPDLVESRWGIRPMFPVDGVPLLELVLSTRPWPYDRLVFVLRDVPELSVIRQFLKVRWPSARVVVLSDVSGGALLSAMAGIALAVDPMEPLVIDLADILFDPQGVPPVAELFGEPDVAGALPWFPSDDPAYSYLEIAGNRVLRTAEKQVISREASAGVYLFRDTPSFLEAAAHALRHGDGLAWRGVHFLCPSYNGLIAAGRLVRPLAVTGCRPVGKLFKD